MTRIEYFALLYSAWGGALWAILTVGFLIDAAEKKLHPVYGYLQGFVFSAVVGGAIALAHFSIHILTL